MSETGILRRKGRLMITGEHFQFIGSISFVAALGTRGMHNVTQIMNHLASMRSAPDIESQIAMVSGCGVFPIAAEVWKNVEPPAEFVHSYQLFAQSLAHLVEFDACIKRWVISGDAAEFEAAGQHSSQAQMYSQAATDALHLAGARLQAGLH